MAIPTFEEIIVSAEQAGRLANRPQASDDDIMQLRAAFGDPVVTQFVEQFGEMKIDPSDIETLHAFFTRIYDAGYRKALPEQADADLAKAFRDQINTVDE